MKNQFRAVQFAIVAVLLWSTVATAFKISLAGMTPIQLLSIASISSFIVLLCVVIFTGRIVTFKITLRKKWKSFVFFSLLNPVAYYLVLFSAYDRLPASQAQSLNYTWAIALTVLSAVFLGQTIRRRDWVACFLGYFGVFIIATSGNIFNLEFEDSLGVGLALLSTFLWATYWILNTKMKTDPIVSVCLCFFFGSLWLLPGAFYFGGFSGITQSALFGAIYVGLFEMGITFVFWLMAMRYATNTSLISNLIFVSPFISLLLLHFVIGEEIFASTIIGLAVIILGLLVQNLNYRK